jgi:glycosyltransferase involved in cell wall biosynthesis
MASGTAVVATAHGGACEMISDGSTGVLIPHDDPSHACEKILPMLLNEDLRKAMGRSGNERLKKIFSLTQFNNNIVTAVEQLNAI